MARFLEFPKSTRNQSKLDCISVACYKLWSLVLHPKWEAVVMPAIRNGGAKFPSKYRAKEIELSIQLV